jgi:non-ribosomal peptide synthase protein (TIGR01720 family)
VLRYINKEKSLQGSEPWDIQFNYLGQVDNVVRESTRLSVASEPTGAGRSEKQVVSEKLSINSHIKAGQLICVWRFSRKHYREETIKNLAKSYLHDLSSLVTHCLEQGKNGAVYTPSDYGLGSAISYKELDAFLEDESDNVMSF